MMSWLVDTAHAMGAGAPQGDAAQAPSPIASLVPFVLIMVVFYFLFFRPQQKRAKEHQQMLGGIERGDDVITSGGILGKVAAISDDILTVEIAQGVKIRVQKSAIISVKKGEKS